MHQKRLARPAAAPVTPDPTVWLIFGGVSPEHAVSCLTAASVEAALHPNFSVKGIGISRTGEWVLLHPQELPVLDHDQLPEVTVAANASGSQDQLPAANATDSTRWPVQLQEIGPNDVVFPLLHGPFGEDGTIQGMLELLGVRYVGSGVLACAAGMDKHYMKLLFAAAGLPVGRYTVLKPGQTEQTEAEELRFPVFVKPARGGSSLGIVKAESPADLAAAIETARQFDPKVIVEEGLIGARELECAVLETADGPQASVVGEVVIDQFYDFANKYSANSSAKLQIPADLDPGLSAQIQGYTLQAFTALGCEGLARVDFFLTADGALILNEINTMPGFTENSMYPQLWAASGIPYAELTKQLVQQAARRPLGLR